MPAPKKYKPIALDSPSAASLPSVPSPASDSSSPSRKSKSNLPKDIAQTRKANLPDQAEHRTQSLDKHGENLRYKAAYLANLIADDMIRAFRYTGKKDVNYIKGLVWNFGVLFDKATGGASTEAVSIRIPAKLLENVKAVIAIQADKKAGAPKPIDVTPAVIPDTVPSASPV